MKNEQRINIKFCVKLGKTQTKTNEMLKIVYGDKCLSITQSFEWHRRFKESSDDVLTVNVRDGQLKALL